jgi:hypothetical protein
MPNDNQQDNDLASIPLYEDGGYSHLDEMLEVYQNNEERSEH